MKGCTRFEASAPGKVVRNDGLPVIFSSIEERTGIQSRHLASASDSIESMSLDVSAKLFESLGINHGDVEAVVLSTSDSDHEDIVSSFASKLAIDKFSSCNFACSGFPRALQIAQERYGNVDGHVLVITSEIMSTMVDWENEHTAILFGDMAAATTLHESGELKLLHAKAEARSDPRNLLSLRDRHEAMDSDGGRSRRRVIAMMGKPLYMEAPVEMIELTRSALQRLGMDMESLSHMVHHQANGKFAKRIRRLLAERMDPIPEVMNTVAHSANVGSASIPYAMTFLQDRLHDGAVIACPAVGAGPDYADCELTSGVAVFRKEES